MPVDCCNCGTICVTTDLCTGPVADGTVTVLAEGSGTSGSTCHLSGKVTTLLKTAAGSGYTSVPTVTIAPPGGGGGTTATATATVSGGVVTGLSIVDGGAGYGVLHPAVTITGGGGSGATGQATATSKCCVNINRSGRYLVTIPLTSYVTGTSIVTATCTTNNASVSMHPVTCSVTVKVIGCFPTLVLPGATVTLTQGAATATGMTDGSGQVVLTGQSEVVGTITISAPRFLTSTVTNYRPSGCNVNFQQVTLTHAAGYFCIACCTYPVPTTLHLTDSVFGAVTLTNGAGSILVTSNPCGGCHAPVTNVRITYLLQISLATPGSCAINATWSSDTSSCPCDTVIGGCNVSPTVEPEANGTVTCPDGLMTPFMGTFTLTPTTFTNPWCSPATITVTE